VIEGKDRKAVEPDICPDKLAHGAAHDIYGKLFAFAR
jgi:hypothetical protein